MLNIQSEIAAVNGTRLYFEIAGKGRPLVLIHGFSLDSRTWDKQFENFAQLYQVIRYDLRGFGKSALPTNESYAHADDLRALLTYLGIAQTYVLGLSMGGWIATNFTLNYPEMAQALILADSALIGHKFSPEWYTRWGAVQTAARQDGMHAARQRWLEHPMFAYALENNTAAPLLTKMIIDYSGWHWLNKDPHQAIDPPDIKRLAQINVPTLILVGEQDIPDFQATATTLHDNIRAARKVVLPGAGHLTNMEAPWQFNTAVQEFLRLCCK